MDKLDYRVLEKVRSKGKKDDEYTEELNHFLENEEQVQNIIHQQDGIL
jgi:hypothetical protein